jgi:ubiquinone/menaquinone biosynthesis C-methylase UbiE
MTNSGHQKINYEEHWDEYAQNWSKVHNDKKYIGDEWQGQAAGAAQSLDEYVTLIEQKFIAPYLNSTHKVLEIGIGGGRTAEILLKYCHELICADISTEMLEATKKRIGQDRVSYVKLDGLTLDNISPASVDVCFCYDTMVHLEPRDIFNYLSRIPALLKGDRLCIFHHTNILSDLGWQRFLKDWDRHLLGRHGVAFSVMTDKIMEKFLQHLNYKIIIKDTQTVPRDCVWITQGPF